MQFKQFYSSILNCVNMAHVNTISKVSELSITVVTYTYLLRSVSQNISPGVE